MLPFFVSTPKNCAGFWVISGINWAKQYQEFGFTSAINITFISFDKGWGGRGDTKIFATSNGGRVWGFQNIPIWGIRKVSMIDSSTGWCDGGSKLLHTTNGGGNIVGIKSVNGEIPKNYVLKQNYPNKCASSFSA